MDDISFKKGPGGKSKIKYVRMLHAHDTWIKENNINLSKLFMVLMDDFIKKQSEVPK